jgi:hypothetical protein
LTRRLSHPAAASYMLSGKHGGDMKKFQITATITGAVRTEHQLYDKGGVARRVKELSANGARRISIKDTQTGESYEAKDHFNA